MEHNTSIGSQISLTYSEDALYNLVNTIYKHLDLKALEANMETESTRLEHHFNASVSDLKNVCYDAKKQPLLFFNPSNNEIDCDAVNNMCWQKIERKLDNNFTSYMILSIVALQRERVSENKIKAVTIDYIKKNVTEKALQETLQEPFPKYIPRPPSDSDKINIPAPRSYSDRINRSTLLNDSDRINIPAPRSYSDRINIKKWSIIFISIPCIVTMVVFTAKIIRKGSFHILSF